jgi:hypothetical protein
MRYAELKDMQNFYRHRIKKPHAPRVITSIGTLVAGSSTHTGTFQHEIKSEGYLVSNISIIYANALKGILFTSDGDLVTTASLSATAALGISAYGAISSSTSVSGLAVRDITAIGDISTTATVSGEAGQPVATGDINTTAILSGTAAREIAALGDINTTVSVSAIATRDITAIGTLVNDALVAGVAERDLVATGDINTTSSVTATATRELTSYGGINTTVSVSATAERELIAAGSISATAITAGISEIGFISTASFISQASIVSGEGKVGVIGAGALITTAAVSGLASAKVYISDNFDIDTIANWTPLWSSGWAIDSGGLNKLSGPTSITGLSAALINNTSISSIDQWAVIELDNFDAGTGNYLGLVFRSSVDCYDVVAQSETNNVRLIRRYNNGNSSETLYNGTVPVNWIDGHTLGASITGTGANTILSVWQNPLAGANPSSWGYPDYSGFVTGNHIDTGDYVGVSASSNTQTLDNFFAGYGVFSQSTGDLNTTAIVDGDALAISTIYENFSGTLTNWVPRDSSGWSIAAGQLLGPTAGDVGQPHTLYNTKVNSSITQFAQVKVIGVVVGHFLGVALRHDGTDNADCYTITWQSFGTNGGCRIEVVTNGVPTLISSDSTLWTALATNDVVGATVQGTSAGTIFKMWQNPIGDPTDPRTWGTPTWTYKHTTGTFKNTGNYVGIVDSSTGTSDIFDDFYGGKHTPIHTSTGAITSQVSSVTGLSYRGTGDVIEVFFGGNGELVGRTTTVGGKVWGGATGKYTVSNGQLIPVATGGYPTLNVGMTDYTITVDYKLNYNGNNAQAIFVKYVDFNNWSSVIIRRDVVESRLVPAYMINGVGYFPGGINLTGLDLSNGINITVQVTNNSFKAFPTVDPAQFVELIDPNNMFNGITTIGLRNDLLRVSDTRIDNFYFTAT